MQSPALHLPVLRLALLLALAAAVVVSRPARAAEPVCARVKIEIEQELTFEREAFEARMTINNGLAGVTLTDIDIEVLFSDAAGDPILATSDPDYDPDAPGAPRFFIRLQDGYSIPSGIAGETSSSIRWLIIPAANAGGVLPQGEMYQVGARLSYRLNGAGDPQVVEVSPDFIFVRPQPRLDLDYFLPREVHGDDPFTVPIEEAVPFSLGVRIRNTGFGPARNLKIDSSQPRIIENKQGLLVNFTITGSEVNGQPAQPTLLADFGTIEPGASSVARWIMECSLYGTFIEFTASFSHADELGGQLTSLIRPPIRARLMLGDVLVDLPGRDAVRDFLAYESHNVQEGDPLGTLLVFESDTGTVDTPVSDVSAASSLSGSGDRFVLAPPTPATGMLYARKPDPRSGGAALRSVTREDGYSLPPTNFWLSKTWDKVAKRYDHYVNLFDAASPAGQDYELTFGPLTGINRAPVVSPLGDRVIPVGAMLAMTVQAFDPDATEVSIVLADAPVGVTLERMSYLDGYTLYMLRWQPNGAGTFPVRVLASDGEFETQGSGRIVVTGGIDGLFAGWKAAFGITDDLADHDRDGLDARLEYALDLDPFTADRRQRISFDVVDVDGESYMAVTFVVRADDPRLLVAVEAADSLRPGAIWEGGAVEMSVAQDGVPSHMRRVRMRDTTPLRADSAIRRFLRLTASFNPTP